MNMVLKTAERDALPDNNTSN